MPTKGGKPQPGERIRLQVQTGPGMFLDPSYGTVVSRSPGVYWGLWVHWDDKTRRPGGYALPDAGYYFDRGELTIVRR